MVDDIADNSFLLQTLLQAEGYQVDVADDGFSALAKVEADPPNLVLMDVMMPEMNGYEVTQRIRQNPRLPFVPIVMVTGHDQPMTDVLSMGANGLIRKPIDFQALLDQICSLLPVAVSS